VVRRVFFLPLARRPAVTGRRRQQNGGGTGDRRRQRTENTRFPTKFKVTQSCDCLTVIFPGIPLFLLLMLNL